MTASQGFLTLLVMVALVVTTLTPLGLLIMLVMERKKGRLW